MAVRSVRVAALGEGALMGIRPMWLRRVVSVAGFVALLLLVPVAGAPAQL